MFGRTKSDAFDPAREIPDLTGKFVLVTGGNGGVGYICCLRLAEHHAHVYMGARNRQKAQAAKDKILQLVPDAKITILDMDLTSLESIRKAADKFKAESSRLDILLNNAGVMAIGAGLTKDGFEMQMGTNHIGHFYLTKLLLPLLQSTTTLCAQENAKTSPGASESESSATPTSSPARVINVTSLGHQGAPKDVGIHFDRLTSDMADINTWIRYNQSKLANVLFTRRLAALHPSGDILTATPHPGLIDTGLADGFQEAHPILSAMVAPILRYVVVDKPEYGALNSLFCATSPHVVHGGYYLPVGKEGKPSKLAQDDALAERLWDWTEAELEKRGF